MIYVTSKFCTSYNMKVIEIISIQIIMFYPVGLQRPLILF